MRLKNWGTEVKTIRIAFFSSTLLIMTLTFQYKLIKDKWLIITPTAPYASSQNFSFDHNYCIGWKNDSSLTPKDLSRCTIGKIFKNKKTIFVFGDSYAEQLIPAFYKINKSHEVNIILTANSGCPTWLDEIENIKLTRLCSFRLKEFLSLVNNRVQPEDKVIFSNFNYGSDTEFKLKDKKITLENYIYHYNNFLTKLTDEFAQKKVTMYVLKSIPTFTTDPQRCIQPWSSLRDDCQLKHAIIPSEKLISNVQPNSDIHIIDPYPFLFEIFSSNKDYFKYLHNSSHLSIEGAFLLEQMLANNLNL